MKAEILSIGTELMLGDITDTNASWLARRLADLGIDLYYISQVGDNLGRISETIARALARADLVISTGGLGPTGDDLTREAIASVMGEQMVVQPELEQQLRDRFERRGVPMPASNVKQATLIPSAHILPNPIGSAPGWWVQPNEGAFAGRIIVSMPGVPFEMKQMWQEQAEPELAKLGSGLIYSLTIKTVGIGESAAEEMVRHLMEGSNPTLAPYAKPDGVHLRATAKAATHAEAEAMVNELADKVREALGPYIYGYNDETLEWAVGKLLLEHHLTLGTMESFTGGLIAHNLTNVVGSSKWFQGGIVAYQNELKEQMGVHAEIIAQHGVISAQCAAAMATAARQRTSADIGLGTTGVAGPDEQEGKPAGTVFLGIDFGGQVRTIEQFYRYPRIEVKRLGAMGAVNMVRRALLRLD
ncbi:MAG: competence/damage-inducible protein A [Candidatus Chloroheliales bacterium]|nr:MAG: competence/damage-inducible protein A [Chloroflexota bacterium]